MDDMIASIPRENRAIIKNALEAVADPEFHKAFLSAIQGMTSPAKAIAVCLMPLLKQMEQSGIPEDVVIGPQGAVVFLVADLLDILSQAGMDVGEQTAEEAIAEIQKLGADTAEGGEDEMGEAMPEPEPEEPAPEMAGEGMEDEEAPAEDGARLGGIMAARRGGMRGA